VPGAGIQRITPRELPRSFRAEGSGGTAGRRGSRGRPPPRSVHFTFLGPSSRFPSSPSSCGHEKCGHLTTSGATAPDHRLRFHSSWSSGCFRTVFRTVFRTSGSDVPPSGIVPRPAQGLRSSLRGNARRSRLPPVRDEAGRHAVTLEDSTAGRAEAGALSPRNSSRNSSPPQHVREIGHPTTRS
jgi:hypothetical protein